MIDMIFLEHAIAFVIVATLAAVATTSGSQTVRGVAQQDGQWQPNRCPGLGGADRLAHLLAADVTQGGTRGPPIASTR
jgi:hypothetical protein